MAVRRGVFETNSSSTHSIAVQQDGLRNDRLSSWGNPPEIHVYPDEFGWEVQSYYDAQTKVSYLYTYLANRQWADNDHVEDYQVSYDTPDFQRLTRLIQQQCGDFPVVYETMDGYRAHGYIDHQSYETVQDLWEESDEYILDFLFNPNSVLHTDNDNH